MVRRATVLIAAALGLLLAAALFARGCRPEARGTTRAKLPAPVPEPRVEEPSPPPPPPPPPPVVVQEPPRPAPPPPAPPAPPPVERGVMRGTVRLAGPVPARRPVAMNDPQCAAQHPGPLLSDELVVDRKGRVQWAFVYLKRGVPHWPQPAPREAVVLDQIGCRFTPHVLGLRVAQPLRIKNADGFLHNVHSLPLSNREFNLALVEFKDEQTTTFKAREVMVPIRCDIHPWMKAWVGVMDHPFFAVTDPWGVYVIRDVPPGHYTVAVWHERCHGEEAEIDVSLDGVVRDFTLRKKD